MDMVKLVEEGTYKKEDLSAANYAFVSGMELVKNELLDNMFDDGDFDSFSPTLAKIQKEMADEVIRIVKEWLHICICETIVELVDGEAAEKEKENAHDI